MSLAAVFSPMPGTPGRLSLGSPRSAAYSGYCAGVTPGALDDAGLVVERVVGDAALVVEHLDVRVVRRAGTQSRSPVTITTSMPVGRGAASASVAMTSSASTPGDLERAGSAAPRAPRGSAASAARRGRASPCGWPCSRRRARGGTSAPGASNATAMPSGCSSAEHLDEHRREAVDRVRDRARGRREVGRAARRTRGTRASGRRAGAASASPAMRTTACDAGPGVGDYGRERRRRRRRRAISWILRREFIACFWRKRHDVLLRSGRARP